MKIQKKKGTVFLLVCDENPGRSWRGGPAKNIVVPHLEHVADRSEEAHVVHDDDEPHFFCLLLLFERGGGVRHTKKKCEY